MKKNSKKNNTITITGYTTKQIRKKFKQFVEKYGNELGCVKQIYKPRDSKGKFVFEKFYDRQDFGFSFIKGNLKILKSLCPPHAFVKATYENDLCHNLFGPAQVSYTDYSGYRYHYAIDGNRMSRNQHEKYIQKALATTNFNRYHKIRTLENYQKIYIHYNRTEQLKTVTERIDFLKVVKKLEKQKRRCVNNF